MSNGTIHRQAISDTTVIELLKARLEEGKELHKSYTQVSIVYLGINSILAALAFKDALQRAWLFELLGIFTAIFFLFVCKMEYRIRGVLESDVAQLNDRLGRPLSYTNFPVLTYGAKASFAWALFALLCWTAVLVVDLAGKELGK